MAKSKKQGSKLDPYKIKYSTDNYIEFKGQKVYFPFPCYNLFKDITQLREKLLDVTVCATDLQHYPELIFDKKEFAGHYDLAGWVYNIIYTWVKDINERLYNGKKSDLFNDFLELCKEKALAWKNRTNTENEKSVTKTVKLTDALKKLGFFGLEKVKELSEHSKLKLVELLCTNPMPYGIAMFDELGFCAYLDNEQGANYKANIILSRLYNEKAKDGTSAKHYRRSLIKPLERYKACEYKETVRNAYQNLK